MTPIQHGTGIRRDGGRTIFGTPRAGATAFPPTLTQPKPGRRRHRASKPNAMRERRRSFPAPEHPLGCHHVSSEPRPTEVVDMCHDWWMRREMRRQEQFDEELRYLLDEERRRTVPPTPVVEHEPDEEPADPKRSPVEAATRS